VLVSEYNGRERVNKGERVNETTTVMVAGQPRWNEKTNGSPEETNQPAGKTISSIC